MIETVAAPTEKSAPQARPAIIDCDLHNELDSIKDLYPYLSERWRNHIDTFGLRSRTGATTLASWAIVRRRARLQVAPPGPRSTSCARTSSIPTTSPMQFSTR